MRVFINAAPVEVEPGTDVCGAVRVHDPDLESRIRSGEAYVTDGRGIEIPGDAGLRAGAILRVVVRARRRAESDHADA